MRISLNEAGSYGRRRATSPKWSLAARQEATRSPTTEVVDLAVVDLRGDEAKLDAGTIVRSSPREQVGAGNAHSPCWSRTPGREERQQISLAHLGEQDVARKDVVPLVDVAGDVVAARVQVEGVPDVNDLVRNAVVRRVPVHVVAGICPDQVAPPRCSTVFTSATSKPAEVSGYVPGSHAIILPSGARYAFSKADQVSGESGCSSGCCRQQSPPRR